MVNNEMEYEKGDDNMSDKLPKSIRVGSVDYNVKEVADLHDSGQELLGWVTYHDASIRIDSDTSEGRKKNVLIHEILHAMLYEAGYDEQDEDLVRRLGNVLSQVLIDNDFGFMRKKETII